MEPLGESWIERLYLTHKIWRKKESERTQKIILQVSTLFPQSVETAFTHSWAIINICSINECFMPQLIKTPALPQCREGKQRK